MTGEKLARRFVAREILRFEADSGLPVMGGFNRFELLVKQVSTFPLRQREQETHRCVAEEAARY